MADSPRGNRPTQAPSELPPNGCCAASEDAFTQQLGRSGAPSRSARALSMTVRRPFGGGSFQ
eukprot:1837995-Alexandrium_andersonii.AAC.1